MPTPERNLTFNHTAWAVVVTFDMGLDCSLVRQALGRAIFLRFAARALTHKEVAAAQFVNAGGAWLIAADVADAQLLSGGDGAAGGERCEHSHANSNTDV